MSEEELEKYFVFNYERKEIIVVWFKLADIQTIYHKLNELFETPEYITTELVISTHGCGYKMYNGWKLIIDGVTYSDFIPFVSEKRVKDFYKKQKEDIRWLCFTFREMLERYNHVLWIDDLNRFIKIEKEANKSE